MLDVDDCRCLTARLQRHDQGVGLIAGRHGVVGTSTCKSRRVRTVAAINLIRARTAPQGIVTNAADQAVIASIAVQHVVIAHAVERIIAVAAMQGVLATWPRAAVAPFVEDGFALITAHRIVATVQKGKVVTFAHFILVVTRCAHQQVVAAMNAIAVFQHALGIESKSAVGKLQLVQVGDGVEAIGGAVTQIVDIIVMRRVRIVAVRARAGNDEVVGVIARIYGRIVGRSSTIDGIACADANDRIVAATTGHDVAAATAGKDIVAGAADQGIVAVIGDFIGLHRVAGEEAVAVAIQRTAVIAGDKKVVAGAASQDIMAAAAPEHIVAGPADQRIVTSAAVQGVVAAIVRKMLEIVVDRRFRNVVNGAVAAHTAEQQVVAVAAGQAVIMVATVDRIIVGAAIDRVVAVAAGKGVGAGQAGIVVVRRRSFPAVRAGRSAQVHAGRHADLYALVGKGDAFDAVKRVRPLILLGGLP